MLNSILFWVTHTNDSRQNLQPARQSQKVGKRGTVVSGPKSSTQPPELPPNLLPPMQRPCGPLLLLCLVVALASSGASSGFNCNDFPCLPGVEVLGMGWDAVHGQTRPLPVVEYTYTQVKKYYNPCNSSAAYLVPDQITVITQTQLNMYRSPPWQHCSMPQHLNLLSYRQSKTSVAYSASQQAKQTTSQIFLGADVNWTKGTQSSLTQSRWNVQLSFY